MLSWSICCPSPFICCSSEQICVTSCSPPVLLLAFLLGLAAELYDFDDEKGAFDSRRSLCPNNRINVKWRKLISPASSRLCRFVIHSQNRSDDSNFRTVGFKMDGWDGSWIKLVGRSIFGFAAAATTVIAISCDSLGLAESLIIAFPASRGGLDRPRE
ncbi:uncharacterized protein LOC131255802 isoform X3 [Magnolia sinica]|uniref:uncharacterized protein LOC131255802 isoform X3 n=1 Tax=Magnolia sinica TaxID=86752 RepID=UPI00265B4E2D|nr:uncharacterized protein LOC131255802 isoform X3 [Magnolia sinica]